MMTNNEGNFYSDNSGATSNEQYWAAINFWFADTLDGGDIGAQNKIWFGASATTDATLRRLFGDQVRQAIAGDLHHWCQQPVSTMALVLLLDQFTRNIFRGDARPLVAMNWLAVPLNKRLLPASTANCRYSTALFFICRWNTQSP